MNDSNRTLRWNRTYQEATGKRLSPLDFAERPCRGDQAVWWTVVTVGICFVVALVSGVAFGG